MRIATYARVSTQDQQTLPLQIEAMRKYAESRNWTIVQEVEDIRSGVAERRNRELLLKSARRKEIDAIVVWRLDRWGRSLADLILSLKELSELGVGFVSLTEAIDLTTPTGRALAGMLSVFAEFEREILRQRVKAGIAQARKNGGNHGRPRTAAQHTYKVKKLADQGLSKSEIARRLDISRASVMRILAN
ncbi:MAG TPA: recombinase family protein [Candidatus Melainabacteria bacterium]|jgi:putative DNA-invertase from lambdoid prophage Rac|nr:MAG: DNA-invertase hin [bacterium ADurb.Bin425]HNB24315.1 recombinase family protein [Candidatus Melainabacteria bacterium]